MLIEKFKKFKEVSEIWVIETNDQKEYFIILNNKKYDFDLMHQFFEIEKENFNEFYDIHYVPTIGFDRNYLYNYKRIY